MSRKPTAPCPRATVEPLPVEVVDEVRMRLRPAGGQVAAVERMLHERRDCAEVDTQLTAAVKALKQAGFHLLIGGLESCLEDPSPARARASRALFERLFLALA